MESKTSINISDPNDFVLKLLHQIELLNNRLFEAHQKIAKLQEEATRIAAMSERSALILEDKETNDRIITKANETIEELQRQRKEDQFIIERLQTEIKTQRMETRNTIYSERKELKSRQKERNADLQVIDTFRKEIESQRLQIDMLQKQLFEAQKEADSFCKSIWGFYRKKSKERPPRRRRRIRLKQHIN